jgi:hypothetical protein
MGLWKRIGKTAGHVRDILTPRGAAGMIAIEGIESPAALVRAIDAAMPRGATLWVDYPGDAAVELFLTERTRRAPEATGKTFRLTIRGDNLPMLARLVDGAPPRALGIHIGVDHDRRRLLSAFDLDSAPMEVAVSPRLSAEALRIFKAVALAESERDWGRKAPERHA